MILLVIVLTIGGIYYSIQSSKTELEVDIPLSGRTHTSSDFGDQNITTSGTITGGTLTDGTATIASGVGTFTGLALTTGDLDINGNFLALDVDGNTQIRSYDDNIISFDIGETGTGDFLFSTTKLDLNGNNLERGGNLEADTISDTTPILLMGLSSANITFYKPIAFSVDRDTIADTGDGSVATHTLTPTTSYVELTCNDDDGACEITMGETSVLEATHVTITSLTANTCTFADTPNVSELAGGFVMGQYDTLELIYTGDRWVEVSRSNN